MVVDLTFIIIFFFSLFDISSPLTQIKILKEQNKKKLVDQGKSLFKPQASAKSIWMEVWITVSLRATFKYNGLSLSLFLSLQGELEM